MMTKPSSSPRAGSAQQVEFVDLTGATVRLGREFGRGGEGSVYEIVGEPTLLAKIYHKRPLAEDHAAKLTAMAARWSADIERIAAWPRTVLLDPQTREPCGLVMICMEGARPLHELYGTTNRRRHFPDAYWHHLILASRNVAAAFNTLHTAGVVVGDVNQGNMLVDANMCVRLIDCDSFQISCGDRVFNCPVGTPHFTPPELQSATLREVVRTEGHDRFGLAVLIFHLMFVGRHPFAGRYRGAGDLSIEKAIAEQRFAFSKNRQATLVDPPPASLRLEDLPPDVAALFESAFRGNAAQGGERPKPLEWIAGLESLIRQRKVCSYDAAHVYYGRLDDCPWCAIEDAGGPSFFVSGGGTSLVTKDRLAALDLKLAEIVEPQFPELPHRELKLPGTPTLKALKEMPKATAVDLASAGLIASWGACAAGVFYWPLLAVGAVGSVASAGFLLRSPEAKARRKTAADDQARLDASLDRISKSIRAVQRNHAGRERAFDRAGEQLGEEFAKYRVKGDDLRRVIAEHSNSQMGDFLRNFSIREYRRNIRGLTPSMVAMLEAYNVETAYDVEQIKLLGVPNIDPEVVMELGEWRRRMEEGFVFNPEHGVTIQDLKVAGEIAERRFKLSQARKILMAARQREQLVVAGKEQLGREVAQVEKMRVAWTEQARRVRDDQSRRRSFERALNSTKALVGASLGVPAAAGLLHMLFR